MSSFGHWFSPENASISPLPPSNYSTTTTIHPSFAVKNDSSVAVVNSSLSPDDLEEEEEELTEYIDKFLLSWPFQVAYIVPFAAMVIVAAGGNLIVVWLVVAHKRMRTVTNYFLVNLAVADALISIANTLFNFLYMLQGNWIFGRAHCRFSLFIATCTISASVFTFMAIAIDRYMAIIHPLKPRLQAMTVLYVIGVIWIASVIVSLPNLLYSKTYTWRFLHGRTKTICYLEWPDGPNNYYDFAYNVFLIAVNYFVPLIALAVTYTIVGRQLWGSETIGERTASQTETIRSKRKVVKMMIVVVVIFAICWLPQHVYFIVRNVYAELSGLPYINHVYLVIYWIAMSNSMYNPIMYCWMNARFRNGFKYVFRFLPCITWQSDDSLGLGRTKMVRISATNGMYRMQEETATQALHRKRTEAAGGGAAASRDVGGGATGHRVKLALTTQIVDLETASSTTNARPVPHSAKPFSTAGAKTTTTAAAKTTGGMCRLKHTYKHTGGSPQDNY